MRQLALIAALAAGALWHVQAHAFLCARDVASLKQHLAANSPTPFTIRIKEGSYAIGGFALVADAPVTIQGGYLDDGCLNRDPNPAPAKTVIDAQGQAAGLAQIEYTQAAGITLDGVTLANGKTLTIETGNQYSGYSGNITLRRTRITNWVGDPNALGSPPPVTFDAELGNLVLENVLIDHLSNASNAGCAVDVHMAGDSYAALRFVTAALNGPDKLCLSNWVPSGDRIVDIDNSLVWAVSGNGASQISQHFDNYSGAGGTMKVNIVNSGYTKFDNYFGFATVTDTGNIFNYPNFVNPAASDFQLAAGSAAINAGATQFPNGSVPPVDIEGNPRPDAGGIPDAGAFEFQKPAPTLADVTNANDSGPGSLRDAIHYANQQAGPTTITFHVPGYCPYIIPLQSTLESITKSTIIDGTTNPGYVPNSSPAGFNGNNCVVIRPASGTLIDVFNVPAAAAPGTSLTVKGISMSGFVEPIVLAGGSNHLIIGNQFGGTIGGLPLSGSTFQAISVGSSVGSNVQIGGDDLSARNVIDNGGQSGIVVSTSVAGCQIVNNLIGLDIDGKTQRGAQSGIHLSGDGCKIRDNRIGGNSGDGIWLQGDNNTLKRNIIGVAIDGSPAPNGGWGIRIDGSGNTVGLGFNFNYDGQFNANYVSHNAAGGITVTTSSGNSIRGNVTRDNGANPGDKLDIDLGADGASANLTPNPGTGPNELQNHPLITGLQFAQAPNNGQAAVGATVQGQLYGNPGTYQLDIYFAQNGCGSGQRGHAENYLASAYAVIGAGKNSTPFAIPATLPIYFTPGSVVAAATDPSGNTSELGKCTFVDTIMRGGFDQD
jgi:parallel beta-helix repeat protein